jgi:2-dehydropantoate 2-reductase
MRFVSYGVGAVGGVVAGRLAEHDREVVAIARGRHLDAIRRDGLRVGCPDGAVTVPIPAVGTPSEVDWRRDDVVLLGVKSQDTAAALDQLRAAAPGAAVVCLQNGVENERQALRRFERVYGVCVMLPTGHLEPGVVLAFSSPITGLLDIGRYPSGVDGVAEEIAAALRASTFESVPRPDIMRWKHNKLLMNLGNAVEAAVGVEGRFGELAARVREEGVAVLTAAGIPVASDEEDAERRGSKLSLRPIEGQRRGGGSSWQSLARGTGTIEADFLNGEIVLLGRLHGEPTPANALMQEVAHELARSGAEPGSLTEAALLRRLGS